MRCSSRPPKVSMTQHWNTVARELEMEPTHLFTHLAEVAREEEALWSIAEFGLAKSDVPGVKTVKL